VITTIDSQAHESFYFVCACKSYIKLNSYSFILYRIRFIPDTVYFRPYAWPTKFSVMALDVIMFYFTNAATIKKLLEVLLQETKVRKG
jgi:hypothetical protein